MKKVFVFLLVVAFILSATACGQGNNAATSGGASAAASGQPSAATTGSSTAASASAANNKGGSIVIGQWADTPNTAAWMLRSGNDKAQWVYTIYEPLFTLDDSGKVVPYLAKSIDSDATKLTYTITLRDDVVFSDGSKLDADALLWNFENFKKNASTSSTHFGSVDSFEKTGDNTVVIHMAQWSSQIPYSLCSVAGLMYSKKAFDDHGYDWCLQNAVGTGPYLLQNSVKDESKTFVLNDKYWNKDKKPALDKIVFKVVPDETTAQAALINGDLDAFCDGSLQFCKDAEAQGFPRIKTKVWDFSNFLVFASKSKDSPLSNVLVRQAICYAIDQNAIKDSVDLGLTVTTNQYALKGTPFYTDTVQGYNYDPQKAKDLLAQAGYPNGFKTTIYTGKDFNLSGQMVAIQGFLSDIGIKVDLVYQDVQLWSSKTIYSIPEGMILVSHGFGTNIVNQAVANFSKRAVTGVGMLKDSKIYPDDLDSALMNALQAKDAQTMTDQFAIAQKLLFDQYCLAYPVDSDAYSCTSLRKTFNDNGCFGTNTEYYNYSLLTKNS